MPPKIIGRGRTSFTRKQIIEGIQQRSGETDLTSKELSEVLSAFLETYKSAILQSDRVEIRGLGIIEKQLIRGRIISHPETKESTVAAPYYRLSFIPCKELRDALKEKAKEAAQK